MVIPLVWAIGVGVVALFTSCTSEEDDHASDYNCPILDEFPPNRNINYSNLSSFLNPGIETIPGESVKSLADRVSHRAENIDGEYRFFKALNQLIHENGFIPNPKPREINELICARSVNKILSSGNIDSVSGELIYSGCHDIGLVARSTLILLGYDVVFVDSVSKNFLDGGSYSGHVFLEVHDPVNHTLFLYDPTAGKIYLHYDPDNYTLPGGYLVYAKGYDSWSMFIGGISQLNTCLNRYRDEFYDTSSDTRFSEINYKEIDLNAH